MTMILLRSLAVWALIAFLAVMNGTLRVKLLVPAIGEKVALPISGLTLSVLIFLTTYLLLPFLKVSSTAQCWVVGGFWLVLTVGFEFGFGHYVAGKSWGELLENYNVLKGNLWVLALAVTFLSPYIAAKVRGMGQGE